VDVLTGLITSILQREPEPQKVCFGEPKCRSDKEALDIVVSFTEIQRRRVLTKKENRLLRWAFKRCRERGLIYMEG
jgi:hypothetical protein